MQVFDLFPTPVGVFHFDRQLLKSELNFIKKLKQKGNEGNTTSVDHNVLENKQLEPIKSFICNSVDSYYDHVYKPSQDTKLRVTQSWCNYTKTGQFHHKHAHPNSFVSGVFYVQADVVEDKIYFFKDSYEQLRTPTREFNLYNSESWWLEAFTGRLLIFPSRLTHMVAEVTSKQTRVSIAFNTFPTGDFGSDSSLTGLKL